VKGAMSLDIKIISDAQKGKASAQSKIYDLYAGAMLGICVRYTGNLSDAEDVLQEAFIKVFTHISKYTFNTIPSFSAWIKKIMVNTALNHIRSNKKNKIFSDSNDIENTEVEEEVTVEDTETKLSQRQLLEIIQNLPEGYRMVFNLYVFENFTHKEIADSLEISVNTSKTQLFKARKMLQGQINKITKNNC